LNVATRQRQEVEFVPPKPWGEIVELYRMDRATEHARVPKVLNDRGLKAEVARGTATKDGVMITKCPRSIEATRLDGKT
jgi:hypothetical protein